MAYSVVQDGYPGMGNLDVDPQLTWDTYRLRASSPCVDAGADETATWTDPDGEPRWDDPSHANAVSIV